MMRVHARARVLGWAAALLLTMGLLGGYAHAAEGASWKPHALSTAKPAARPLGCRTEPTEKPCKPDVDSSALPPLQEGAGDRGNPYRGQDDAQVVAIGQAIFNQTCAYCHGADAVGQDTVGPDLRRYGGLCKRIADPDLRTQCTADADAHFMEMVLGGRTILGISQMPAWASSLTEPEIWSLQMYLESEPYGN